LSAGRAVVSRPRLPRVLVADDGRHPASLPAGLDAGILLRDTELPLVVARSASAVEPLAVDLDGIRGLEPDDAAVEFVVRRLGIGIVLTRRPQAALRVDELGGLALLHLLAFDSTGLGRALDGHPGDGVGSVVSPGLVLRHMVPAELTRLPRPILGYGLLAALEEVRACLRLADAVALRAGAAAALASHLAGRDRAVRALTTAATPE